MLKILQYIFDFFSLIINIFKFVFEMIWQIVNVLIACVTFLFNIVTALPVIFQVALYSLIVISVLYKVLGRESQS